MSLFLTKEGKRKSPMAVTIFFVDLLFCLVFGGAYALLTEPLHSLLPLGGGMPETVLHCLIIAVIGTAVCCVLFLLPDKRIVPYSFAGLPVITIIMNNRVLGTVRQWQTMFYGSRYSQTDPHRKTDYVKLADAFGAVGYRVSNIAELREALRKAQQSDGPVLIDCQIDKDERVLPMIPAGGTVDDLVTE